MYKAFGSSPACTVVILAWRFGWDLAFQTVACRKMNLENNPENTRGGCARDALVRVLVVYPPRDFARSRQSLAATSLQK